MNRRQLFAQQDQLTIALQALAVGPLLHFRGVLQRPFDRPEAHDQIFRALLPDPRRARNVIG